MTNREKLIDLLTECDGEVDIIRLSNFIDDTPLTDSWSFEKCSNKSCVKCIAVWLNEEAKE